jgi:hypothetical protein
MKLTNTPPAAVHASLIGQKNHIYRFCPAISAYLSVGDFITLSAANNVDTVGLEETLFAKWQMLKKFWSDAIIGKVNEI